MGHIGAYIPHLWGRYPPLPSPRRLFLIYGLTDGRDDFPIKIQPLKIHFYFLTKIQNKTQKRFILTEKWRFYDYQHSYSNISPEFECLHIYLFMPGKLTKCVVRVFVIPETNE